MKWPDWTIFPLKVVSLALREIGMFLVFASIGFLYLALALQNLHRRARGKKPIVVGASK